MESYEKLRNAIIFFVNGKKITECKVDPMTTLLTYLREKLRLTGAKMGCNEGGCGSCTVMISKYDSKNRRIRHYAVSACLLPIGTLHGLAVTTVEGIGSTKTKLHPVQERIAKAHGSQCGFCTPGFVMSMYTLLRNNPEPSMEEIELNLIGNLCRCTGYRPILEGFKTFSKEYNEGEGCGRDDCCRLTNGNSGQENNGSSFEQTPVLFDHKMFTPYDPTQDIIFPPELKINASSYLVSLNFSCPKTKFFRTSSLRELLALKNAHNDAVIIVGNAKIGVDRNIYHKQYPIIIHPVNISEMTEIKISDKFLEIGAASSISDIESFIKEKINEIPGTKAKILLSIKEMLKYFADRQIKNVASVAGSIMIGFSESDFNTILVASKTKLVFQSVDNHREVLFDDNFLENHLKNIANSEEVLVTIKVPLSTENEYFRFYKHSRRKGKDLAIVNAAIKISFDFPSQKINDIIIALGSIKRTTMLATKTMQSLIGQTWTENVLGDATSFLIKEMKELDIDNTICKGEYKVGLAASFFFKFYLFVCEELHKKFPVLNLPLKEEEKLLTKPEKNIPRKSTQFFQNVPEDQEKIDPIGRPIPHVSALRQTTGEATYVNDIPRFENELHAALILSEKARAKIVKIDPSEALKMEGVHNFFSANDLSSEQNITGYVMKDEEVFASKEVRCVGQIIGVIVAETMELAEVARKTVRVQYEDISQPILSIEEAIKANSVWEPLMVENGNVDKGFQNSKHVLQGESRTGFQEHFYMETNTHVAVPYDNNEIHLIGTYQSPSQTQMIVARALNLEANRVYCKVKRMGGGFGGKESRHFGILIPIAFAAMKTERPVRICLSRKDDMIITGGRNPVLAKWKVGFEEDGKLNALDVSYYLNAGCSLDLTDFVRKMLILKASNGYHIENIRARGQSCKTNLPSNTAFRGFGSPQAIYVMENIIVEIAEFLRIDPNKIREKNMYDKLKSFTYYGQEIIHNTIRNCWEQILFSSSYYERKFAVDKFNRKNVYKKRGISAMPIMFGIGFSIPFMHQAGALIMVYTDGSVLLSHGGVELGQGLNTKMLQIASRVLEISIERIYIAEASTDKVPNTIPTVASTASDLNGMAVLEACRVIKKRLEPYKSKMADKSWNDWVQAAYMDRVSLSATGYHKTPNIKEYDFANQIAGDPFVYFSFGSGVTEVEIDCLTGDHLVLRTDIIMDVGKSLNPAIDIGQIEGAFMQGYGLFTLEELVFSSSGKLLTTGPHSYKIPDLLSIPREFNVTLLRDSINERAVYSSKAIGEPPLLTGVSVFLAIREAVKAARNEDRLTIQFDSPATSERIRMACQDWITKKIAQVKQDHQ